MSFRRLPQLLLLRSDGKGKIGKSIVRARKRKKEKVDTQKRRKKTKAKKIMVLKRHNSGEELHQIFSDHASTLKVPVNVIIKNMPHFNDILGNRFKILWPILYKLQCQSTLTI